MLYFAYGMNLNHDYMHHADKVGPAVLKDWQMDFRYYCDVQPRLGEMVYGGVWEIDEDGLRDLDRREGYPHLYDRKEVTVQVDGGGRTAIVYFMKPRPWAGLYPIEVPGPSYYELVREGYQEFGIKQHLLEASLWRAIRGQTGGS